MPVSTTISLPFVFDLSSQQIIVFGEDVSAATLDASFNLTVDMSASIFASSLLYNDSDVCGNIDISYVPLAGNLAYEINRLNVGSTIADTDSYKLTLANVYNPVTANTDYNQYSRTAGAQSYPPTPGSLRQHFMQYMASIMFGHPQAQAPIKNDDNIMTDLSNCDLGAQFDAKLGAETLVRHSMLEQLIAADVSGDRFDVEDTSANVWLQYPFLPNDKIVFRVAMSGKLEADSASQLSAGTSSNSSLLYQLFNGIPGILVSQPPSTSGDIEQRYWKVTITLQ